MLGVDGYHNRLAAESTRSTRDKRWVVHSRRIKRDLVGTSGNHTAHANDVTKTPADGKGDGHLARRATCEFLGCCTVIARGGDIEENNLVGTLGIVERGQLDGVAGIAQVDEVDALHNAAVFHIHAGNDTFCKHIGYPFAQTERASSSVNAPS